MPGSPPSCVRTVCVVYPIFKSPVSRVESNFQTADDDYDDDIQQQQSRVAYLVPAPASARITERTLSRNLFKAS